MTIELQVGDVVDDRYELLSLIGEGATGAVYRARQRVVEREVAVKVLHKDVAEHADYRARFEREARALGTLQHPRCVQIHDFGWDDGRAFLVSEYISGIPLFEGLELLNVAESLRVAAHIASALKHAHQHGVIHRDLKPENVLLGDGQVDGLRVVDFGLATVATDPDEVRVTRQGDAYGTPAYMSPEQCQGELELTGKTDVYSLGCMLYEMLERQLPFSAPTASGMLIKHVTGPIPEVTRDVPDEVKALTAEMMAKKPTQRPSMAQVEARLLAVLGEIEAPDAGAAAPVRAEQQDERDAAVVADGPSEERSATDDAVPGRVQRRDPDLAGPVATMLDGDAVRRPRWPWFAAAAAVVALGLAAVALVSTPGATDQTAATAYEPDDGREETEEAEERPSESVEAAEDDRTEEPAGEVADATGLVPRGETSEGAPVPAADQPAADRQDSPDERSKDEPAPAEPTTKNPTVKKPKTDKEPTPDEATTTRPNESETADVNEEDSESKRRSLELKY